MRQIEFQTSLVGDVKCLVSEVGNELVTRDVLAADELAQSKADHAGFHRQMSGTEWICRVSVVQVLGVFDVDLKIISPIRLMTHRIHIESIDFGLSQKSEIADRKTECLARCVQRVRVHSTSRKLVLPVGSWAEWGGWLRRTSDSRS